MSTHDSIRSDDDARTPRLARADIAVLRAFAQGANTQQVAVHLHMSRSTLTRRMAGVREVFEVRTNIEAVVAAVRAGLI